MILQGPVYNGLFDFNFITEKGERISYFIDRKSDSIEEVFKVNGNVILQRDSLSAELTSTDGEKTTVHPPKDKLVLHVRRDVIDYPHFEELINWCAKIHSFKFGHIHANSFLSDDAGGASSDLMSLKDLSKPLKELDFGTKKQLIKELNEIGFPIIDLNSSSNPEDHQIHVNEADINFPIQQSSLSQGMFRAISLMIYVNYLLQKGDLTVLLVDDLCEGLDYQRSSQLGKMLFQKFKDTNVQFIATTNDYFLMEHVPLKYWNVLNRKGTVVTSLNHSNSKEIFQNFKFTGLSNFDFFSSDYLTKKPQPNE